MTTPDRQSDLNLWLRWIAANAAGELLGLGLIGAVGLGVVHAFGEPESFGYALTFAVLMIGLGGVEGLIVGAAQAWVLRRRLPRCEGWVTATVVGAVAAWTLGMLPSTWMALAAAAAPSPAADMSDTLQAVLAVPLGLVTGAILGFPQWRVLKRHVRGAGWWVAANAAAWAAGMPVLFFAVGYGGESWSRLVAILIGLTAAGALVGAIHGAVLVRLTSTPPGLRIP